VFARHAEPGGRFRHRRAPLVERLPVFRIAGETDDHQQERLEHQANPTIRR
jgi:hypothetical protein